VSGKKVEFSGHLARIGSELRVCLDPAYSGRGQRGLFIPGMCLAAPLSRFAIRRADQPRQGVRGYAFVIIERIPRRPELCRSADPPNVAQPSL
jgi:hypothetical protein